MPTNDQIILAQLLEQSKTELAPGLSEADFFEVFCADQVLKDYDLSNDEIDEGIVGSGGDGGIDSFYVFINGELLHEDSEIPQFKRDVSFELHLIQAKRAPGFSEDAIHKFRASSEDLLDLSKSMETLAPTYNAKLLSIAAKFREAYAKLTSKLPGIGIHYYYATTATEIHPNVKRQVETLSSVVTSLFSNAEFTFDFLGAKELLDLARAQPSRVHTLKLAETPISVSSSFICLVSLPDYAQFITDEHGHIRRSIFDANVRDYQGDVEVNRAIRSSLQTPEGEDFWWLNNGITVLAGEATHSGKMLTIKNPQIVNGLQTSQEVFRALQALSEDDARSILVRVIVPQAVGSYQRIVKATNSQTAVPPASLRTTDPFHRDIEDYLRAKGLYYERRKNFYKNEGRPRDSIISVSYLAQAVMAVLLGRPDDARARPSTLLKSDADYQKVFASTYPIEIYLVSARLMKRCEAFLRARDFPAKEVNNLKFHIAMYASRVAANDTAPSPAEVARIDVATIDDDFLEGCLKEVAALYNKLGATDEVAKGPKFVDQLTKRIEKATYAARLTSNGAG